MQPIRWKAIAFAGALLVTAAVLTAMRQPGSGPRGSPVVANVEPIASPAGDWSGQPNLSVGRDGSVLLIWMERPPNAPSTIKFARYNGTSWSAPRVIITSTSLVASAADIPSLLELPSGRLAAHWQQLSADRRSYGVRLSQSRDQGLTWSTPVIPHPSHETGENGFVSLFAATGDSAGVVWLDGRNTGRTNAPSETMLAATRLAATGGTTPERVLDQRVCDCCHTAFAATGSGGILAYRDRTEQNVRDIAFMRYAGGTWSASSVLNADGWVTPGCPVNGPSVGATGEAAAIAWFTNARDTAKVLVAFSADATRGFSRPVRVDTGDPLGRAKVVLARPGLALVSWLERVDGASRLQLRRVTSSGQLSAPIAFTNADLATATGFPQMVEQRGSVILAWPAPASAGTPARVRVARAAIP